MIKEPESALNLALKTIYQELRKHDAKFTSFGDTILDDIQALKPTRQVDPWAWETTIRRIHMIITRPLANLPYHQLYHLAIIANPKALWNLPNSKSDTYQPKPPKTPSTRHWKTHPQNPKIVSNMKINQTFETAEELLPSFIDFLKTMPCLHNSEAEDAWEN